MKPGPKPVKLEDLKELQGMLAEQLDGVERGLRLIDTAVGLGTATIDLLAQDANARLTLIAMGFDADDEMMMRALEAYSWCVEEPDAVQRLYPASRVSVAQPPRVIFVAERVPDAFRRKVKHLRFNRVDCFEFRFGLLFTLVEAVRGTHDPQAAIEAREAEGRGHRRAEEPPAAADPMVARAEPAARSRRREEPAPAPAPAHAPAPVAAAPAPPPPPTPSFRRGPGKPVSEVDDEKVRVVREYLQREFQTAVIYDFYSHDLGVQMFHLQDSHGAVIHSAAVAEELLAQTSDVSLTAFLDEHKLARALREASTAAVAVSKTGIRIERR